MSILDKDHDQPTLDEQISELQRELKMRDNLYPSWIRQGKLSSAKAWTQIRNVRAALNTLLWLQKNSTAVKTAHELQKEGV